jgi:hypothetical protein
VLVLLLWESAAGNPLGNLADGNSLTTASAVEPQEKTSSFFPDATSTLGSKPTYADLTTGVNSDAMFSSEKLASSPSNAAANAEILQSTVATFSENALKKVDLVKISSETPSNNSQTFPYTVKPTPPANAAQVATTTPFISSTTIVTTSATKSTTIPTTTKTKAYTTATTKAAKVKIIASNHSKYQRKFSVGAT